MRTLLVVGPNPVLGDMPDVVQVLEDVEVQDLFAVGAVEALDQRVLHGFAGLDELQVDLVVLRPLGQGQGDELRAVV